MISEYKNLDLTYRAEFIFNNMKVQSHLIIFIKNETMHNSNIMLISLSV